MANSSGTIANVEKADADQTNPVGRSCLYCGGVDFAPLFADVRDRLGHVSGHWDFWRCCACRSAILAPFPKPQDLATFYPAIYSFALDQGPKSTFRRCLARLEYYWFYQRQYEAQARRIRSVANIKKGAPSRLLDIGCGRGLRLLALQRRGFEVHGMDFQQEAVEYVRDHLKIPAVRTEIDELPTHFSPATFDCITAFYVLEHVPDVELLLTTCHKLLRPGGWLVLAVPYIDSLQAKFLGAHWSTVTEAPRHLSIPTQDAMRGICRRTGFDEVILQGDSVFMNAGVVGLSLVPGSATTHLYTGGKLRAIVNRLLGAAALVASLPLCWLENHLWRRPGIGLVFARKPAADSGASS